MIFQFVYKSLKTYSIGPSRLLISVVEDIMWNNYFGDHHLIRMLFLLTVMIGLVLKVYLAIKVLNIKFTYMQIHIILANY